jgi:hypothetical protein
MCPVRSVTYVSGRSNGLWDILGDGTLSTAGRAKPIGREEFELHLFNQVSDFRCRGRGQWTGPNAPTAASSDRQDLDVIDDYPSPPKSKLDLKTKLVAIHALHVAPPTGAPEQPPGWRARASAPVAKTPSRRKFHMKVGLALTRQGWPLHSAVPISRLARHSLSRPVPPLTQDCVRGRLGRVQSAIEAMKQRPS